jgi:co-chaperonin GroES (HSP10)
LFKPVNRYVSVTLPDPVQNMTESGILVPEDFVPKKERHVVAQVIQWAPDVRFEDKLTVGAHIVIDNSMVEEINIKNKTINVILDNYIIGIVEEG